MWKRNRPKITINYSNIELYSPAIVFYTHTHTLARARVRGFVIPYFEHLEGLGLPCTVTF